VANPTTNYGFVLPTPTDLVTDLPADFDVALQGVDTRLKALQPGTTLGDLAYSSATANTNTRLPIGTTGQVLAVSGGVPAWTTAAAGAMFKITSASFSAVSDTGTTFDGIFTSTYANSVVVFQGFSSVDEAQLHIQTRAGASTQSGTDYYGGRWWVGYNASTEATATSSQTKWSPMKLRTSGNGRALLNMNFSNVGTGSSVFPVFNGTAGGGWLAGAWLCGGSFLTGAHNATGLIFSASSGTITGTVYVYGVQN
jgi:hypothetical protein